MIKPEYAWNRVYCFAMNLKADYLHSFPEDKTLYDKGEHLSVIHKWAELLKAPYYLDILRFLQVNTWNNFCLFKYKPYTAIFGDIDFEDFWEVEDQFYRSCRGVTVDVENDELVLCGFDKFFNIDELPETSTKKVLQRAANAKVMEVTNKLDGSIQLARYYNEDVVLSGSTAIDPEVSYRVTNGRNFIMEHANYLKMLRHNPDLCFIFESLTPDDPHVVSYDYETMQGLWLIGAREIKTGHLLHYFELAKLAKKFSVNITDYEVKTMDEVLDARKAYKCDTKEGWVLNLDGWRVKIKCDDFLTFHGMLSGIRKDDNKLGNAIMDAMRMDRLDDFLSVIPMSFKRQVDAVLDIIRGYIKYYDENGEKALVEGKKATTDVKSFMLWVNDNVPKKFADVARNKYRGKETPYLKGKKYQDILDDKEKNCW